MVDTGHTLVVQISGFLRIWPSILLMVGSCGALFGAPPIEVVNTDGGITVRAVMGLAEPAVRATGPLGPGAHQQTVESRSPDKILIRCAPQDGAAVDLEISVPHNADVSIRTTSGAITVMGLLRRVSIETESGDIRVEAPLGLTRIRALVDQKPASIVTPAVKGVEYLKGERDGFWAMADADRTVLYARKLTEDPMVRYWHARRIGSYGDIEVKARSPRSLKLVDADLPSDSWIRPTGSARKALEQMLHSRAPKSVAPPVSRPPSAGADGELVYSADVRLVTLHVPVYGPDGRPVPGLKARDFELAEDGRPQRLAFVADEELAFDLVLLLDLSDSTSRSREEMVRAARGFVRLARPEDRVAVYAFAEQVFQVISPLSSNHAALGGLIESIAKGSGDPTTALYDAIALSLFQEKLHHSARRAALVVLSDGLDNSLARHVSVGGSAIDFRMLKAAVSEWPVLVYSILLPGRGVSEPDQGLAARRMHELTEATGGKVFEASSARELEGVYERVAEELRSIYTLGYYPSNQDFNGKWRKISLRAGPSGQTVRAKPGYYAR